MFEYGHNWTQVETCDFISRCYDRDTLLLTLLNYGEAWLSGRMICVVGQEHIQTFLTQGWSGWGTDEEITREMSQHRISLEETPILEAVVEDGTHTIGSSEELGLTGVFEAANVFEPEDLVVIPLQLAGRTKMLLLGEPKQLTEDLVQFSEELEPLVVVADQVAHQLEEIIKLGKAGKLPPADERIPDLPSRLTEASAPVDPPRPTRQVASVIMDMDTARSDLTEGSESIAESSPPQLHAAPPQLHSVPRHTQPIRLQRETSELPSLNTLFDERGRPDITLESGESTHMGTPLNMIQEGMSIEIVASVPPVLDKDMTLSQLPGNPFDEEPSRSPAPQLERPSQKTSELEGVNIIQPIGIKPGAQRTLMGGFSIEDFKRAQERFAEEESKPRIRRPSTTLPGVSTPMAQIIRPKRRHKLSPEEEQATGRPTLKVEAITREYAEQDRQERLAREAANKEAPLMMPHQSAERMPTYFPSVSEDSSVEEHEQDVSLLTGEDLIEGVIPASIVIHASVQPPPPHSTTRPLNAVSVPTHTPMLPRPEKRPEQAPFETRRLKSIITKTEKPQPAATLGGPSEVIRTMSKNWAVLFSKLESRDRDTAFSVVTEFDAHPAVLVRLEEIFPGRLYVDRYQWTVQTLPPVEKHGPVIATLHHLGQDAAPILIELMSSESLEIRFYATYLISSNPLDLAIPQLLERIFDRDIQTRKLAARGLLKLSETSSHFEERVITSLAEVVERHADDFHVEVAAELLGELRLKAGIAPLINVLDRYKDRLKQAVYLALMKIALQPLPSATIAWRTWHRGALHEDRTDWILRALVSPSDQIRKLVKKELVERFGDPISYDPDQPQALRQRSQQELKSWFDSMS